MTAHTPRSAKRRRTAITVGVAATHPGQFAATVIVSSQTPFPTSAPDAQAWRTAQAQFAKAAPNRQLVTAAHSSHDIPLDRPDIVEAQIEAMVKATS